MGYDNGGRVDGIVWRNQGTHGLTREEWKLLAMAALDQAGVSAADQQTVRILLEVAEAEDGH